MKLGPYASALKDGEIDVNELPMPRVMGEGEEEPVLVWAFTEGKVNKEEMPKRWPGGHWIAAYLSRKAALAETLRAGWDEKYLFRFDVIFLLNQAKGNGLKGVVLIDESYTVIDSWRVR